jgi:putative Holliday junction resolvase
MGIDHGNKRIGVAVSDANRMVARELTVIERTTRAADFETLVQLIEREEVVGIVIGMPYSNAPSDVHTHVDTVRLWISRLREHTTLPMVEWDENLTSADALELARFLRRKPSAPLDDLAARLMLQSYLDALNEGLAESPEVRQRKSL